MSRRFAPLAFALFLALPLAADTPAAAQEAPPPDAPVLTVRTGAMQAVSAADDGLAPYVEGQVLKRFGAASSFGVAAHAGLSYERYDRFASFECVIGPCPPGEDYRESYLGLVTGVRVGVFPADHPVSLFTGFALHTIRRSTSGGEQFVDDNQDRFTQPTVQLGGDVQLPITSRLSLGAGIVGYLPVYAGDDPSPTREREDLSRLGVHLSVQYGL